MPLRVKVEIGGAAIGGGIWNFHFIGSAGTAANAVSAVVTFLNAIAPKVHTGTSFKTQSEVETFTAASGAVTSVASVTSTTVVGGRTGELAPYSTQGLLRLRTGHWSDGKEIRGRLFIPGVAVADVSGGYPLTAYQTAIDAAAATLVASGTADWCVWRRRREPRPVVPPGPGHPNGLPALDARDGEVAEITSASCWNNFASLRSRRD